MNKNKIYATPDEVTLTPFDPTSLIPTVTLALWMKSSMFETCINHQNVWLAFDVHSLYHNNLCQVRDDDDFVGLYVDDENDNFGGFELSNRRTRRFIEGEIPLISVHLRELAVPTPQFQHEYHVIVGIHSNEFRRLITYLGHFGVLVAAHVTDTKVKFSPNRGRHEKTEDKAGDSA
ncbi:proliferating cell nuclear antigen-like [Prunus dulcis]|uniref:proliferating cell nuclear antigen-like n=1 Tax=Prunus dulcis TaxID=3755 RepID=UPI001482FA30|nr:proliferating cell nuclear antigen-like [Prunus dulcis]